MDVHTLFWMTPLCFMMLFSIKQVVLFFSDYLMNDIAQAVMRDVRSRLFERIQTLSLDYFSRKRTGELVSRITNDVGTIENAISYAVTDIFKQPFLILVFMGISFMVNTKGTLFVLLLFPLIGWPMALINKKLRKIAKNTQEKMADINSHLMETISGVRILKAFGTEKYEIQRFRQQNHDYYKLRMKTIRNMNPHGAYYRNDGRSLRDGDTFDLGQRGLERPFVLWCFYAFYDLHHSGHTPDQTHGQCADDHPAGPGCQCAHL